jgi:hypothetical protein
MLLSEDADPNRLDCQASQEALPRAKSSNQRPTFVNFETTSSYLGTRNLDRHLYPSIGNQTSMRAYQIAQASTVPQPCSDTCTASANEAIAR